jgi:hypothetical protein
MKCVRCWVRRARVDLTEDPLVSGPDSMIEEVANTLQLSFAHATSPKPGDLFILDVADHGGLGDLTEFVHPNSAAEAAELK